LYDQTHRLTQLGVLLGTDVMYLARVGHQGHQRVASPVAGRIPATCTALGKALLAHNPVAIEDATRSDMVRRTRHSITQAAVLRSQLAQVRRVGFAFEYQEARIGLACVASPVMTGKSAAAAISITGPSDSFDPLLSARGVRTAARRLSKVLGERG
jgi:DNA-binding IclR family transcriptional regulator